MNKNKKKINKKYTLQSIVAYSLIGLWVLFLSITNYPAHFSSNYELFGHTYPPLYGAVVLLILFIPVALLSVVAARAQLKKCNQITPKDRSRAIWHVPIVVGVSWIFFFLLTILFHGLSGSQGLLG